MTDLRGRPLDRNASLGAIPQQDGRTRFTVWAPRCRRVDLLIEGRAGALPLESAADGYFTATHRADPGERYRFRLDGGDTFPDPCSRFQPEGPHGPSEIIDPTRHAWSDGDWKGLSRDGQVLYELHVGTFTREGTYAALTEQLPYLKDLGVTVLELMPLHDCPGGFNWGYDGVDLFAPNHTYGRPDDLRQLVDRAHALGLGVILDVVYNHLGPDGNYLHPFAEYFTQRYAGEWGAQLDFDGPHARPVRDFVLANACAWIREYHFDGLRVDATQNLCDASPTHIVKELSAAVRAAAAPRSLFLVGEGERQDVKLLEHGLDAIWVDDFHHVNRVIATGGSEAYLQDYEGTARELVACVLRNSLYQGQYYPWQQQPRGTVLRDREPGRFVFYLQNHDQIANSLEGTRLHRLGGEGLTRALTTLFLLAPQTPMLFMGQEFFAATPFHYFVDHSEVLARAVESGRRDFLSQFTSARAAIYEEDHPLPLGRPAFEASKLDGTRRDARALRFHQEVLALRKRLRGRPDAAALSDTALCLRWPDHLLLLELGRDHALETPSEPLLAPPPGRKWKLAFSSELSRYGGRGAFRTDGLGPWRVQGHCATVLEAA